MAGLFAPKIPDPKPVAPMPDPEGPESIAARRRAQSDILSRAGRSSTILTSVGSRSGANFDTYSSKATGAG
jgi:hypothetical protein